MDLDQQFFDPAEFDRAEALFFEVHLIVEKTVKGAEHLAAFEAKAVADEAVRQCYRVSPGPDFLLILQLADMAGYHALVQRLFTQDANVRNVKAFFSVKRSKFEPYRPLGPGR